MMCRSFTVAFSGATLPKICQSFGIKYMNERDVLKRIKSLRMRAGIGQIEMANLLGKSYRAYQRIENGETNLKLHQLVEMLRILDPGFYQFCADYFERNDQLQSREAMHSRPLELVSASYAKFDGPKVATSEGEIEMVKLSLGTIFSDTDNEIGYWEWDLANSSFYWSKEMYNIYDYPEDKELTFELLCQKIDPNDLVLMSKSLENLIVNNLPYHNTHRVGHSRKGQVKVTAIGRKIHTPATTIIFGLAQEK